MRTLTDLQMRTDPDSTLKLVELLHHAAIEAEDEGMQAYALNSRAVAFYLKGESFEALQAWREMLELYERTGNTRGMAGANTNLAMIFQSQGENRKAVDYYTRAIRGFQETGDQDGMATLYNNISGIYLLEEDTAQALTYAERSLAIRKELGQLKEQALVLANMSTIYAQKGREALALQKLRESLRLSEQAEYTHGIAEAWAGIGRILQMQGANDSALFYLEKAMEVQTESNDKNGLAETQIGMASLLTKMGRHDEAISTSLQALRWAAGAGRKGIQKSASHLLYQAYKEAGDPEQALAWYEQASALSDSLRSGEVRKGLAQFEFRKEMMADSVRTVQQAQARLEKQHRTRQTSYWLGSVMVLVFFGGVFRYQQLRRTHRLVKAEKDRSEVLLLNILPLTVANELKEKGLAEPRYFPNATILFTDFHDFTRIGKKLSPTDLVEELKICFMAFDQIIGAYTIEKIKTIGDAYMCASGLSDTEHSKPVDIIHAALDMQAFIIQRKLEREGRGLAAFEMRAGVHTGPVVAGIVGVKKFQYDIWGDTVNTASRMESSGEVGRVNISEATYRAVVGSQLSVVGQGAGSRTTDNQQLTTPAFAFTPRGKVQAKGKGDMEMYFVERNEHAA